MKEEKMSEDNINRINEKIKEVQEYLEKLDEIKTLTLEEYLRNFKVKLMCERCVEIIIECLTDLAFLVIKEKKLNTPTDDKQAFDILKEANIISSELAEKLKDAKGMRNILAHEYGKVDDEIVFNAINEELEKDASTLISSLKKYFKEEKDG